LRRARLDQAPAAPLLDRAAAYLVDGLVTALVWGLVVLALTEQPLEPTRWAPARAQVVSMLFLVIPFGYFLVFEGAWATTPGKRLFGLEVTTSAGAPAGWYKATVRNVLRLAWSLGPLGPLFLALDTFLVQWTERSVRVGDHAAGTRVVRGRDRLVPV
jgi:uncharacterized RDD family membrane protein YckC